MSPPSAAAASCLATWRHVESVPPSPRAIGFYGFAARLVAPRTPLICARSTVTATFPKIADALGQAAMAVGVGVNQAGNDQAAAGVDDFGIGSKAISSPTLSRPGR
jgi:hypothetical protein